jgi:hypothetical protein
MPSKRRFETNAPPVTSVKPRRWTALSVPVRGVESRTAAAIDVA